MANVVQILKNALNIYDENRLKYMSLRHDISYIDMDFVYNDTNVNKVKIYDADNKLLHNSPFEFMGVFRHDIRLWTWGWYIANNNKNLIKKSQMLLNYAIEKLDNSNDFSIYLKDVLVKGTSTIDDNIKKDILFAMTHYLTKSNSIVELIVSESEYNKLYYALANREKSVSINTFNKNSDEIRNIIICLLI